MSSEIMIMVEFSLQLC